MPRVEKQALNNKQMDDLKGHVSKSVKTIRPRRSKKGFFCCLLPLVILLLLILYVLFMVAQTGLVNIPILSNLAYKPSAPTRVVEGKGDLAKSVSDQVNSEISAKASQNGNLDDLSFRVKVTEEVLTKSIQDVLRRSGINYVDQSAAQVVILEGEEIEIFGPIKDNEKKSALKVVGILGVNDEGKLEVSITQVYVGELRVPVSLAKKYIEPPLQTSLNTFNSDIGKFAKLERIYSENGILMFEGEVTAEKLK